MPASDDAVEGKCMGFAGKKNFRGPGYLEGFRFQGHPVAVLEVHTSVPALRKHIEELQTESSSITFSAQSYWLAETAPSKKDP
jgi:hypothetical protein